MGDPVHETNQVKPLKMAALARVPLMRWRKALNSGEPN